MTCIPALAQSQPAPSERPADGRRIFMPADFERFAPKTALDMVRQIPGFSIDEVEERRGLGQGGSNVLVNGQRFAGKSNDIVAELSRISATRVVRIELVDGATLNIPGLSGQVVNIIAEIGGVSGQFSWNPRIRFKRTPPQLLDAEVSITGKTGKLGYTFSLSNVSRRDGNAGLERVLDASGTLTEQRFEEFTVNRDRPRIAASLKYDADNGATGNLNLSYERYWGRANEDSDGQLIRDRDFYETEKEYNYELGGDYEFPLGGGRLKLIGLRRFEHSPFFTRALLFYEDGRPDEGTRQRRRADETETILRSEYGWHGGGADWQISLEGALNKLDNEVRLESLNANGVFDPVPLPGANSEVREKRAESAISYGRPLTPTLTLQASLGGEYSQITQSGPNGLTRSFIRPKGYVSLAWKANPRLDISARIEREVGQLDFFDFVASTDISAGNQNAANPNLVPQQSWNLSLEATQDLAAWGSLNIRGFINFVSDIVDQIPIGTTGEAPGNLDSARVWGLALDSTLKLDPLGWSGAKLDAKVSLQKSSVADPLTGDKRRISEDFVREIDIALRHDIPRSNWAYGASYFEFREAREVRLGEIQRPLAKPGDLGIFVENKDVLGMTARLGLYNLLGTDESLERTVYVNRRTGPVRFVEDRHRDFGPILAIDLSGSF